MNISISHRRTDASRRSSRRAVVTLGVAAALVLAGSNLAAAAHGDAATMPAQSSGSLPS